MSYLKYNSNGPIKLSVIIASLLSTNCSHFDMRTGLSDNKTVIKEEIYENIEQKPLSLIDSENGNAIESLSPQDPRFMLAEAAKIASKEQKYPEALKYWEQLINQYPEYVQGYIGYSQVGRKINLHRSVLAKLYEFKNRIPNDVNIITEIAKVHYEMQDYQQALEEIDNVINIQNSNWKLYSLRGVINDKLHYYTEAMASYKKALELSPDNPAVLNNMAVSMMMNGNYDDAELYASKAITAPDSTVQAFKTYAKILALKGDTERAEKILTDKLKDEDKAQDIINAVKSEVSKPVLWGRK